MIRHAVRYAIGLAAAVLVSATAWANPGHGVEVGHGRLHRYVTEPEHLLSGLAFVVPAAILLRDAMRARRASLNAKGPR